MPTYKLPYQSFCGIDGLITPRITLLETDGVCMTYDRKNILRRAEEDFTEIFVRRRRWKHNWKE